MLPCDKPQVTYIQVQNVHATQATQAHQSTQASSGPSTSTGGPAGSTLNQEKLLQLASLHKQTSQLLKDLGVDPGAIEVEDTGRAAVPIPLDSTTCPVCKKVLSSHYRAVLHYRFKHLHKTKWYCRACNKYFTSQHNLDEHDYNSHGDNDFSCYLCGFTTEHKKQLKAHLKTHKRYKVAVNDELICEFCLHRKLDMKEHIKTCRHNPGRSHEKFSCTNKPCTSQFSRKKDRNYHEKNKCKYRKA